MLSCPGCHRLVHASELSRLKEQADAAAAAGDRAAELSAWRSASVLVPPQSRQYGIISARIDELSRTAATEPAPPPDMPKTGIWKWASGLGTIGVALWKFKFLLLAVLSKGKLLLLGLTKASTFLSMFASIGVYWAAWGLWFAVGFVLSIYVHEMGHVMALRRFGLEATPPMFIPGLGAFIRLRGRDLSPFQNARIGLAGPLWGLGAAVLALAVAKLGGGPMWTAIAHTGAWLNLFNLLPVWQLDGSRGFAALSRSQRWLVALTFGAAWALTADGLLVILAIAAAVRAFGTDAPESPDHEVLTTFIALIVSLAAMLHFAA